MLLDIFRRRSLCGKAATRPHAFLTGTLLCVLCVCLHADSVAAQQACSSVLDCPEGEQCVGGTCQCWNGGGGYETCPEYTRCCPGDGCKYWSIDDLNCGGCGIVCSVMETCYGGVCTCYESGNAEVCGPDDVCCGGIIGCSNLREDPANCGACGFTCGLGEICADGICTCGSISGTPWSLGNAATTACESLEACCGGTPECRPTEDCSCGSLVCGQGQDCCDANAGACTNVEVDGSNCGACGSACPSGFVCSEGSCACPPGQTECGGECVDVMSDREHCATCGHACSSGEICDSGQCKVNCQPGFVNCGGQCVNYRSDREHCGTCSTACPPGEVCELGQCELSCQDGFVNCGGYCVDPRNDRANCGACSYSCATGEVCELGQCELSCQKGLVDCGGNCVNVYTDRQNCGACSRACATGEVCSSGQCELSCQDGLVNCAGSCANLLTDRSNCGNCGVICDRGEICSHGTCALSCAEPTRECTIKGERGGFETSECVNLLTDRRHCGDCNAACAAGEVCSQGQCELGCQEGLFDCGGFCRDLAGDTLHCGECGNECVAGDVCLGGNCEPSGLSAYDSGPFLYVPYWRILESETYVIIGATVPGRLDLRIFAADGSPLGNKTTFEILQPGIPLVLSLRADFGFSLGTATEGALTLQAVIGKDEPQVPLLNAVAVVVPTKGDAYRIAAVNAAHGAWTTFAQVWEGAFLSADDELMLFCPDRNSGLGEILRRSAFSGSAGLAGEVVVDAFDEWGTIQQSANLRCGAVVRLRLGDVLKLDRTVGRLRLRPHATLETVPANGSLDNIALENSVFIGYLRRNLFSALDIIKTKDKTKLPVDSGYLSSVRP